MFESTGILLLWVATTWLIANLIIGISDGLKKTTQELEGKLSERLQEINETVHIVESLKDDNNTLFWFDRDNGKFLAQGSTYDELSKVLQERFPKHIFYFDLSGTHYIICESSEWKPLEIQIKNLTEKAQ